MPYKHISVEERERIQFGLWNKESIRDIARSLNRGPSSISREIKRNHFSRRRYTPRSAHLRALAKRSSRGRQLRLKNPSIRSYVVAHLKRGWSPEQISGRLPIEHPGYSISHEAIYQYIYAPVNLNTRLIEQGNPDLRLYLKRRHRVRVNKGGRRVWRLMNPHKPSIDDRPIEVNERRRIGDWEGDLIVSRKSLTALQSLVDRKTGLLLLNKVDRATAEEMRRAAGHAMSIIPAQAKHTFTLDNGSENACWRDLEKDLGIACYFAHAYHSWERGTNENTNGLVRWYLPKGTDFTHVSDSIIATIQNTLNTRPRKRLGWRTPVEVFNEGVALTG